jgi:hypothetical protein
MPLSMHRRFATSYAAETPRSQNPEARLHLSRKLGAAGPLA